METRSSPTSFRSSVARLSIGLTGGIGSGKSLVADHLARLGAHVVDTDLIAHELTQRQGAAMDAILSAFGDEFVTPDGALDRAKMRAHIFGDRSAKIRLEQILHPLIRTEAARQAGEAAGNPPYIAFVVPLLVESGTWETQVDRVLVIDCVYDTQVCRLKRRQLDEPTVRHIIAQQASRATRLAAADDVIVNEGSTTMLAQRAARVHEHYCALARMTPRERKSDTSL